MRHVFGLEIILIVLSGTSAFAVDSSVKPTPAADKVLNKPKNHHHYRHYHLRQNDDDEHDT